MKSRLIFGLLLNLTKNHKKDKKILCKREKWCRIAEIIAYKYLKFFENCANIIYIIIW